MPSSLPLPTIAELIRAFDDAVVGQKEPRANVRRGSCYDHFAGIGAVLFSRQAQRDSDLFRAIYFDTSDGDDLTNLGAARSFPSRALDAVGVGTATIARATTSAGAGTVYAGTRISVISTAGLSELRSYVVSADTTMSSGDTLVTVPVRAMVYGAAAACTAAAGGTTLLRIEDGLWDTSLTVQTLICSAGTTFETAQAYRARVRQGRLDTRKGYTKAIANACAAIGATTVVAFASNYTGDANDFGLNLLYVGDASYTCSSALLAACTIAVDSFAVFGTQVQVLPITTTPLVVQAIVSLWDDPGNFNLTAITYDLQQALVGYFDGRANAFTYRRDAMAGAMAAASSAVQSVTFTTPASDQTITTGSPPQFPSVLTRTTVIPSGVLLSFQGPQ